METRVVEVPIPVPGPVQYVEKCTAAAQAKAEVNTQPIIMHEHGQTQQVHESLLNVQLEQNKKETFVSPPQVITKIVEKPVYIEKPYPVYIKGTTTAETHQQTMMDLMLQREEMKQPVYNQFNELHAEQVVQAQSHAHAQVQTPIIKHIYVSCMASILLTLD